MPGSVFGHPAKLVRVSVSVCMHVWVCVFIHLQVGFSGPFLEGIYSAAHTEVDFRN